LRSSMVMLGLPILIVLLSREAIAQMAIAVKMGWEDAYLMV